MIQSTGEICYSYTHHKRHDQKKKKSQGLQLPGGDEGNCRVEHCPLGGHQDKKILNFQLEEICAATNRNNIILWYLDIFNSDRVFEKAFSSPPFKYKFGNRSQTSQGDDTSIENKMTLLLFSGVWKKYQDIPGLVKENPPKNNEPMKKTKTKTKNKPNKHAY